MKTVADLESANTASFCSDVFGGRTPRASRETRVRGRRSSYAKMEGQYLV